MRHQWLKRLGHAQEAVAGNVHRRIEAFLGGVDDATVQVVGIAEGHRVNGEIEFAEGFAALRDDTFEAAGFGNVQLDEELGAEGFGQRLRVAGGLVVLVGDGDLTTQFDDGLGNRIGDRLVVGDAGDQALLAGQGKCWIRGVHAVSSFQYGLGGASAPHQSFPELSIWRAKFDAVLQQYSCTAGLRFVEYRGFVI